MAGGLRVSRLKLWLAGNWWLVRREEQLVMEWLAGKSYSHTHSVSLHHPKQD